MKIIIRPVVDPKRDIDLTHRLVAAIAEELWRLYGGNEQLNWVEAEMHLQRIVGEARAEAMVTEVLVIEPGVSPAIAGEGGRGEQADVQNGVLGRLLRPHGAELTQGRRAPRKPTARHARRQTPVTARAG